MSEQKDTLFAVESSAPRSGCTWPLERSGTEIGAPDEFVTCNEPVRPKIARRGRQPVYCPNHDNAVDAHRRRTELRKHPVGTHVPEPAGRSVPIQDVSERLIKLGVPQALESLHCVAIETERLLTQMAEYVVAASAEVGECRAKAAREIANAEQRAAESGEMARQAFASLTKARNEQRAAIEALLIAELERDKALATIKALQGEETKQQDYEIRGEVPMGLSAAELQPADATTP